MNCIDNFTNVHIQNDSPPGYVVYEFDWKYRNSCGMYHTHAKDAHGTIQPEWKLNESPEWIKEAFLTKTSHLMPHPVNFEHCLVTKYKPGVGIASHHDHFGFFGDSVIVMNLGSGCNLDLTNNSIITRVYVPRRGIYIMTGDARYVWTHGVPTQDEDTLPDGSKLK